MEVTNEDSSLTEVAELEVGVPTILDEMITVEESKNTIGVLVVAKVIIADDLPELVVCSNLEDVTVILKDNELTELSELFVWV